MRTCVRSMVVCVLYPCSSCSPRSATAGRSSQSRQRWRPRAGREQGWESSAAAEAFGVVRGMRLGEAMSRCPALHLVAPDPEGTRSLMAHRARPVRGDRRGRRVPTAPAPPSSSPTGCTGCTGRPGRSAGGGAPRRWARAPLPERSCAESLRRARRRPAGAAAAGATPGSGGGGGAGLPRCAPGRAPAHASGAAALPEVFERLGIRTLGEVAALPSRAVAEQFGAAPGLLAHDLVQGRDTPLDPRRPPGRSSRTARPARAASGQQLERGLELLVARRCSPGANSAVARCARSPCRRASLPAAPGGSR